MKESEYLVVLVTAPDRNNAYKIAQTVVKEKLAACANIIPGITSIYRWERKLNRDKEVLLVIKTIGKSFVRLADRIKSLHPYQVPEIIALPIVKGSTAYLEWINQSLK